MRDIRIVNDAQKSAMEIKGIERDSKDTKELEGVERNSNEFKVTQRNRPYERNKRPQRNSRKYKGTQRSRKKLNGVKSKSEDYKTK